MIHGVKRWTIFPPDDMFVLGCDDGCMADTSVDSKSGGNKYNGLCWCPQKVVKSGDTIPDRAQPYTFDLHPGEIYYMPAGWFHSVQNLDDTIMINQWMSSKVHPQVLDKQ